MEEPKLTPEQLQIKITEDIVTILDGLIKLGVLCRDPVSGKHNFVISKPPIASTIVGLTQAMSGIEVTQLLSGLINMIAFVALSNPTEPGAGDKNAVLLARSFMKVLTSVFDEQTETKSSIAMLLIECFYDPYRWASNTTGVTVH